MIERIVMKAVVEPCSSCQKPVQNGDEFCEACGAAVPPDQKKRLKDLHDVANVDFTPHAHRVKNAQKTIGWLSFLFVFGGVASFFIARSKGEEALKKLAAADASTPLAQAAAVSELRSEFERGAWQLLGLNLFLALVMLVLWLWARRAALPAVITALGIYLAVIVGTALYDPSTLAQGVLMKFVVIVALINGVKSALTARRLELSR